MRALARRLLAVGLVILLIAGGITPYSVAGTPDPKTPSAGASETGWASANETDQTATPSPRGDTASSFADQSVTDSGGPNAGTLRTGSADTARGPGRGDGGVTATAASTQLPAGGDAMTVVQTSDDDVIRQTQTYERVPERAGEVAVTLTYEIPDRVVELESQVPAEATVTGTDGFQQANGSVYEWDGSSGLATISYRINPNQTVDKSGPEGADGRYISVDTGEWALLVRSLTPTRWRYTGQEAVGFNRTVETAGPGAAGEELVYLGEVATFEETAHNQTFTLVIPERTTMTASPIAVLDSMANASNALRVGDRDEQVFVVAAPSGTVNWGVEGFQIGDADMWVQSRQSLSRANNVWLHEYVHSRQAYDTTRETRWTTEGMATYYGAVLTLEQDRIDFEAFRTHLSAGERSAYSDVVLADPSTWTNDANYRKGALVAGRTDVAIRSATTRNRTLQAVLQSLNGYRDPVTQSQFLTEVEAAGGPAARNTTATETETAVDVTMWNETRHRRLFGDIPARIGYSLPPLDQAGAYRVDSVYRSNASVGGEEPIRLATNETLSVDAVVENAGGETGTYNATLAVNESVVAAKQGALAPGSRRTVELSHTFTETGRYVLSVDGDSVTVVVSEPARARVTDVSASSREVARGGSVEVIATVANDNEDPGTTRVVFRRDGSVFGQTRLYLSPQTTQTVTRTVRLEEPGTVSLSAGDGGGGPETAVDVRVSTETVEPTPTPTEPPTSTRTTAGDGAGFTALLAALAVLLVALLARQHRR